MLYTINQLREHIFQPVYQVYQIFQDFFGEAFADLQNLPNDAQFAQAFAERHIPAPAPEDNGAYRLNGRQVTAIANNLATTRPFILVYWPRVRVTNENGRSVYIYDLYAKIELNTRGFIPTENAGFQLNRATYPIDQWTSNYMHSHVSSIPKYNPQIFQTPCLGTGPIIHTIDCLREDTSEGFDETRWMLFCQELSLYVTVESLEGVPYHKLENISTGRVSAQNVFTQSTSYWYRCFLSGFGKTVLKDFIRYYLEHGHLSLNYRNGAFEVGMSYFDYIIDISNAFIDYYNSHVESMEPLAECPEDLLDKVRVVDGKFYSPHYREPTPDDCSEYIGKKVCDFKGEEVLLNIFSNSEYLPQTVTVIHHNFAMGVLDNIIKIINYRYTNEYNKNHGLDSPDSTGRTAPAAAVNQTVYYL